MAGTSPAAASMVASRTVDLLNGLATMPPLDLAPDAALAAALGVACRFADWPVGHAWLLHGDELRDGGVWHLADPDAYTAFVAAHEGRSFRVGTGLPGRAAAEGRAVLEDATDPRVEFDRGATVVAAGLRSAYAVAVDDGERVIGVLEFFGTDATAKDELLAVATQVAAQLGLGASRGFVRGQLEERRHLMDGILEATPDILTVVDLDGRILEVSSSITDVLGWQPEMVVGREIRELRAPGPESEALPDDLGLTGRVRSRSPHADGGFRTLESTWSPVLDHAGKPVKVVVVSRDVTEQVALEEALHDAVVAAREADMAKSRFLSRMSHELRTPLNAILGFAQLLQMDLGPEHQDSLRRIIRGGDHLLSLINEVLDIARIEAGEMTLSVEPVSLRDVTRECVELMHPAVDDAGLAYEVDLSVDVTASADLQRLKQVILNLLSNAVKYTPAGGSVAVLVGDDGDGTATIAVRDTGPGFTPEQSERMFVPFDRLDEDGITEGTGLGLPLARHLTTAMGGELAVETAPGEGSTFTIRLPAISAPTVPASLPDQPRIEVVRDATMRSVLYVEDNTANLRLIERFMAARFTDVVLLTAMHGRTGVEIARQHAPDAVLVDLHLPDIHGLEVISRLRAFEATASVPVIVLTADATKATRTQVLAGGETTLLTKPIDLAELERALNVALALQPANG